MYKNLKTGISVKPSPNIGKINRSSIESKNPPLSTSFWENDFAISKLCLEGTPRFPSTPSLSWSASA